MMWRAALLLIALATLGGLAPASAAQAAFPPSCGAAEHGYRLAQRDVLGALSGYKTCVAAAFGRDDCSLQFAALGETQKHLAAAVADVETSCSQ